MRAKSRFAALSLLASLPLTLCDVTGVVGTSCSTPDLLTPVCLLLAVTSEKYVDLCGPENTITKEFCEKSCQCATRHGNGACPDQIQCPNFGNCGPIKVAQLCNCRGQAGTAACGAQGRRILRKCSDGV
jgi:hypothetical protein